MTTLKEKYIAALYARGYEQTGRYTKYMEFVHPYSVVKIYVGKRGALRYGREASKMCSCDEGTKCRLLYTKSRMPVIWTAEERF